MGRYLTLLSLISGIILCLDVPGAGAQAWKPYSFQGSEHFSYALKSIEQGEEKTGSFTLDIEKAGEGKFKVSFNSKIGENESSSSTTSSAEELPGQVMMSLIMSGNAAGAVLGATLFAPVLGFMFIGMTDLEVGSGWSRTEEGKKMSFKIEAKETIAGHEGFRCVFQENEKTRYLQVIAPDVALPLRTEVVDDDGNQYSCNLVEYRK